MIKSIETLADIQNILDGLKDISRRNMVKAEILLEVVSYEWF
jgi:hypothetical protein